MAITKLTKPVIRETAYYDHTDALIVELYPKYMCVRLKGQKGSVDVSYGAILDLGRKIAGRPRKVPG